MMSVYHRTICEKGQGNWQYEYFGCDGVVAIRTCRDCGYKEYLCPDKLAWVSFNLNIHGFKCRYCMSLSDQTPLNRLKSVLKDAIRSERGDIETGVNQFEEFVELVPSPPVVLVGAEG